MLKDMKNELSSMGIDFEITDDAKNVLIEKGYNPRYGARPIRREIQTHIEDAVSNMLLSGEAVKGTTVFADAKDGEIYINIK